MGRAIDKDKLIEAIAWHEQNGTISTIDDILDIIEEQPTVPQPSNEPLTLEELNKMYLNEVWLEYPDGSGETALVVNGKIYSTSVLEGAGLDLEEYIVGETLDNPTGAYNVYRRPPEGEAKEG